MIPYHILGYNRLNSALLQPVPLQMKVVCSQEKIFHGIIKYIILYKHKRRVGWRRIEDLGKVLVSYLLMSHSERDEKS